MDRRWTIPWVAVLGIAAQGSAIPAKLLGVNSGQPILRPEPALKSACCSTQNKTISMHLIGSWYFGTPLAKMTMVVCHASSCSLEAKRPRQKGRMGAWRRKETTRAVIELTKHRTRRKRTGAGKAVIQAKEGTETPPSRPLGPLESHLGCTVVALLPSNTGNRGMETCTID